MNLTLCRTAGLALAASLFCTPRAALGQSAYSMAWVFDGPGCRASTQEGQAKAATGLAPILAPGAAGDVVTHPCADEALLHSLLSWLGRHLQQPTDIRLPQVAIVDQQALAQRLCPQSPADCGGIMAAYDAASDTVILRDFLDMRRIPDRSFLVHELIHVLQHRRQGAAFQARCSDVVSSEREAYQAQNRYLAAHGQLQRVGQMIGQLVCPREDGEPVMRMGRAP